jgi:hypothetical protein
MLRAGGGAGGASRRGPTQGPRPLRQTRSSGRTILRGDHLRDPVAAFRILADPGHGCHGPSRRGPGAEGRSHSAELRLNDQGPWVIEVGARSIGGLCARALRFGAGISLEELILSHVLGLPIETMAREDEATGVMMIPIPQAGVLESVDGLEAARRISGVDDVTITIPDGPGSRATSRGQQILGLHIRPRRQSRGRRSGPEKVPSLPPIPDRPGNQSRIVSKGTGAASRRP